MADIHVTIDDHSEEVLDAIENAIVRGLEVCGMKARDYAKDACPKGVTGNLQGHIDYEVDDHVAYVGVKAMTPAPYGIYVEFGTGVYAQNGDGRKTPWSYKDANGQWHHTNGMTPRPFLKPAVADHEDEYINTLLDSISNA